MTQLTRYSVAILVRNQFGVLNRVTSMFRRRRFNIACLTVSETETPEFSRITVLFDGDDNAKRQLMTQLCKLPDVMGVREFDADESVSSELVLIKVANDPKTRQEVLDAAHAFKAEVMDYTRESIVLQMTGQTRRIDDFIDLLRDYTILEVCRTGVVSLERGANVMRTVTNL